MRFPNFIFSYHFFHDAFPVQCPQSRGSAWCHCCWALDGCCTVFVCLLMLLSFSLLVIQRNQPEAEQRAAEWTRRFVVLTISNAVKLLMLHADLLPVVPNKEISQKLSMISPRFRLMHSFNMTCTNDFYRLINIKRRLGSFEFICEACIEIFSLLYLNYMLCSISNSEKNVMLSQATVHQPEATVRQLYPIEK